MFNVSKLERAIKDLNVNVDLGKNVEKKRKSLNLILSWAFQKGHVSEEKFLHLKQSLNRTDSSSFSKNETKTNEATKQTLISIPRKKLSLYIIHILLVVIVAGAASYLFFKNKPANEVAPQDVRRVGKTFKFQGKLLDSNGLPILNKVNVVFKLYTSERGGKPIYTGKCSGKNALIPDVSGQVAVMIGSDCGMEKIPEQLFSRAQNIYLGLSIDNNTELLPRYPISTIDYAKNASKVSGLALGVNESSIPYIDDSGKLVIAASSPSIKSTDGDFTIEGEVLTLKTSENTAGSIQLDPDTGGNVIIQKGKLGIGKSNPSSTLDVVGDISLTGNYYFDGKNTSIFQNSGGSIVFYSNSSIDDLTAPSFQINDQKKGGVSLTGSLFFSDKSPGIVLTNAKQLSFAGGIIPSKSKLFDLGSTKANWANIYANNLILPNEGIGGFWQQKSGVLSPSSLIESLIIGSTKEQSAVARISAKSGEPSWFVGSSLGLGTKSPHGVFSALGNTQEGSIASLSNMSTSDTALTNILRLQTAVSATGSNATFVDFYAGSTDDNNGQRVGSIQLNGSGGVSYTSAGADFAEYISLSEPVKAGDVIGISETTKGKARSGDKLIGVVSDNPAVLGNTKQKSGGTAVGMLGQIRTFVSTENGIIRSGDEISAGSYPGIGIRTEGGYILGTVLESNNDINNSLNKDSCPADLQKKNILCGKVLVLVRPYYKEQSRKGNIELSPKETTKRVYVNTVSKNSVIQLTTHANIPILSSIKEIEDCQNKNNCRKFFDVVVTEHASETITVSWSIVD